MKEFEQAYRDSQQRAEAFNAEHRPKAVPRPPVSHIIPKLEVELIQHEGKGRFFIAWEMPDGRKRISNHSFETKEEARDYYARMIGEQSIDSKDVSMWAEPRRW